MKHQALYGFRHQGEDYLNMADQDGEPECLGNHLFGFVKDCVLIPDHLDKLKNTLNNKRLVIPYNAISDAEKRFLKKFHERYEFSEYHAAALSSWGAFFTYQIGDWDMYTEGFPYVTQSMNKQMLWSDTFSYAYILNLDTECFEVYRGNNFENHHPEPNRYANSQDPIYTQDSLRHRQSLNEKIAAENAKLMQKSEDERLMSGEYLRDTHQYQPCYGMVLMANLSLAQVKALLDETTAESYQYPQHLSPEEIEFFPQLSDILTEV